METLEEGRFIVVANLYCCPSEVAWPGVTGTFLITIYSELL